MSKTEKLAWLPNILTLGRIAAIPVLMWMILAVGKNADSIANRPILLLVLFFIMCLSDFFDGYFARKYNLVSDFGRMIDPIADKLMVAGCLIALMVVFGPLWRIIIPACIIIFRDILISGTREHAANANIILAPTKLAKWKTALEMLAIFLLLLAISSQSILPISNGLLGLTIGGLSVGTWVLWLAALLSVWTGVFYLGQTFKNKTFN